jgi:arsenate reductase-like glutaredoxin family protein
VELKRHDLAKDPPSRELLEKLIDEDDVDSFLNKRTETYRPGMTKKQAIEGILRQPNLLRRPLVLKGKKAVFGFQPDRYDQMF